MSLARKIKRGHVILLPTMFGTVCYRKLARGGYQATKDPNNLRGITYGDVYTKKALKDAKN